MAGATVSAMIPGAKDLLLADLRSGGVKVTPVRPSPDGESAFLCSIGPGRVSLGFGEIDGQLFVVYAAPALSWPWRRRADEDLLLRFDGLVARYRANRPAAGTGSDSRSE